MLVTGISMKAQGDIPTPLPDRDDVEPIFVTVDEDTWPWEVNPNDYEGESMVFAQLKVNGEVTNDSRYVIGAFINGVCRAQSNMQTMSDGTPYFVLRVKGSASDNGKTINFRVVLDGSTGTTVTPTVEYAVSETLTYTGETIGGTPSNLYPINLTTVTGLSLANPITINKGESVDLKNYLTLTPANASTPKGLTWDASNSNAYIKVENDILTGLAGTSGTYLGLKFGDLSTYTNVIVNVKATDISLAAGASDEITVNKGDWETLTLLLSKIYQLTPEDATDKVVWKIGDETIIQYAASNDSYNPIKGGTTTMTAQILNDDGSVRLSLVITVHVVVPVESITINWPPADPARGNEIFTANVGDDIFTRLSALTVVAPEDATNQDYTWKYTDVVSETISTNGEFTIGEASIVANKVGLYNFWAESEERGADGGPISSSYITVRVVNQAKTINLTKETLVINYEGNNGMMDVSQLIKNNISFGPEGYGVISNLDFFINQPTPTTPRLSPTA